MATTPLPGGKGSRTKNGALEPGAPFLEKPFTANELAAKVRELLDLDPASTLR